MPVEHEWRNLAEDAVNGIFRAYVGEQVMAVVRNQIGISQFVANITAAKAKRADALEAINGIT